MTSKKQSVIRFGRSGLTLVALCLFVSGCLTPQHGDDFADKLKNYSSGLYADSERLTRLEKLNVGLLPASATNFIEYLRWFNEKVTKAGLPENCRLGFRVEEISSWSAGMMQRDMIILAVANDPGWFHELGISAPNAQTIKHELAK